MRPIYVGYFTQMTHLYSTLIFGVLSLHQIAHFGVSPSINIKLIGREIIFELFQPMWSRYLNVTDGQTDRQTIYWGIAALCVASRGKNRQTSGNRAWHVVESANNFIVV